MGLQNLPTEQMKKRNWTRKFEILNFLDHKNDASENANTYYCYTDGSKMNNHVGFGYQIRVKHREKNKNSTYLGSIATVFQAEVMAISTVARDLQKVRGQRIVIRSDSQAAVLALQSSFIHSSIVEECITTLTRLSEKNKVILQWIKAHVGHVGNEAADLYAKLGSESKASGPEPFLPVPQSFITTKIVEKIKRKWTKRWTVEKSCRQTKLWFETISTKFKAFLAKGSRIEVGRLVQFITGHCNLRKHQNLINNEVNPNCRLCNLDLETPWHLVTVCPGLLNARENLFQGQILHSLEWTPQLLLRFCKVPKLWTMLEGHE